MYYFIRVVGIGEENEFLWVGKMEKNIMNMMRRLDIWWDRGKNIFGKSVY